jgi:CarD family transcriptional regulator
VELAVNGANDRAIVTKAREKMATGRRAVVRRHVDEGHAHAKATAARPARWDEGSAGEAVSARARSRKPGAGDGGAGPRTAVCCGFGEDEFVVYPACGVGQIVAIDEQEVAGFRLELFVIRFVRDRMILKVPTAKAKALGMRKVAGAEIVAAALDSLAGRAGRKGGRWEHRARAYQAKIHSGSLIAIAEVVRDLYRRGTEPEAPRIERELFELARDRAVREIAVAQNVTETESLRTIEARLQKGCVHERRGRTVPEAEPGPVARQAVGEIG